MQIVREEIGERDIEIESEQVRRVMNRERVLNWKTS